MKRKLIFCLSILLVLVFLLVGCTAYDGSELGGGANEDGSGLPGESTVDTSQLSAFERKIIYTASFTLQCDDIPAAINLLRGSLKSGEWFDEENIYSDNATFTARVKSERLDEFIAAISSGGTVYGFKKTATDISLDYTSKQLRIDALEAEHARLLELLSKATLSETLTINSRLSSIEAEIAQLKNSLNLYDSRIEYSVVTVNLTKKYVPPVQEPENFGQRILLVFNGAFKALGEFFKFILLVIIAVFPFALIIIPAAFLIFFLVKLNRKKAAEKLAKKKAEIAEQKSKPQE